MTEALKVLVLGPLTAAWKLWKSLEFSKLSKLSDVRAGGRLGPSKPSKLSSLKATKRLEACKHTFVRVSAFSWTSLCDEA